MSFSYNLVEGDGPSTRSILNSLTLFGLGAIVISGLVLIFILWGQTNVSVSRNEELISRLFTVVDSLNPKIAEGSYGDQFNVAQVTVGSNGDISNVTNVAIASRLTNILKYNVSNNCSVIVDVAPMIQNAIDNEDGLYFPTGCYYIGSTLNFADKSGLQFVGAGGGSMASETVNTKFIWIGSPGGTMFDIVSNNNLYMGQIAVHGSMDSNLSPNVGIHIRASNMIQSGHWNYLFDVSISFITNGDDATGLLVGSYTNDDQSNSWFERLLIVSCNIGIRQIGSQTINNNYQNSVILNNFRYGMYIEDGDCQVSYVAFYSPVGDSPYIADFWASNVTERITLQNNYHELLTTTNASGYVFEYGPRSFSTKIDSCRILSTGAYRFIDFQQDGDLIITNTEFGGTNGGTVYLRTFNAVSRTDPSSLTMYNNKLLASAVYDVEGNWNYQDVTSALMRSILVVQNLANVATAQEIFTAPFNIQGATTYEISGNILISRTSGTTAHTIAIGYATSTANVIITTIYYDVATSAVGYTSLSPVNRATALNTADLTITTSNSNAVEFVTVSVKGLFRTAANGAGTFNPTLTWSAAPGGAPAISVNSWMKLTPISWFGSEQVNKLQG